MIVLFGVVSFRSVPRILKLFLKPFEWIPHFSSVINWTLLLGLSLLKLVSLKVEKWLAIVDHSIDIGVKKVMVVLRVNLDTISRNNGAVTLDNCECIGIQVSENVDGETVAKGLKTIFEKSGTPTGIIRDGGSGLSRGVNIWREEENKNNVAVIEDIGHVLANALKSEFSKSKKFKLFLKIINKCARRLRQTKLAFLSPPKLRTKGRFQGIGRLSDWALKILSMLSDETKNNEYKVLKIAVAGISDLKDYVLNFANEVLVGNEILKILKNGGLNQKNYWETKKLAENLPEKSKLRKRFLLWLERHLTIHCRLGIGQTPLVVSSDIIESLFGKFKHILERGTMADMNRTVLIIPTLCGKIDPSKMEGLLNGVSHSELQSWEQNQISYTQNKLRKRFTQEVKMWVPKTG